MRVWPPLLAVGVLAVVLSPQAARAQGASAAQVLYQDGQRLVVAGDTHSACLKFAESERIDPRLNTLIALAACHEKEGKLASAWGEFVDAAEQADARGDATRHAFARDRALALEPRIHRVTIVASAAPPGLQLAIGGKTYGAAMLGSAIPLDRGTYEIVVTAPGKRPWTRVLAINDSPGQDRIDVTLEDAPAPAVDRPTAAASPSASGPGAWPVALGAAGGVAVVVGVVAGFVALGKKSDVESACGPGGSSACSRANEGVVGSDRSAAVTAGTVADVGLVTGAVLVGLAAILYFTSPSSSPRSALRTQIQAVW